MAKFDRLRQAIIGLPGAHVRQVQYSIGPWRHDPVALAFDQRTALQQGHPASAIHLASRPQAAMNPGIHRRSGRDGCPDSHPISLLDCRIHRARPEARRDELPNPSPAGRGNQASDPQQL
jgi:hypothetical protein